jgi:hypothetical protein
MIFYIEEAYHIGSDLWSFDGHKQASLPHSVQACTMLCAIVSEATEPWAKSMTGITIMGSKTWKEMNGWQSKEKELLMFERSLTLNPLPGLRRCPSHHTIAES